MKKIVCVAALVLCMCRVSFADDASKRAKIDEMFTLMNMEQTLSRLADQQTGQMKQIMPQLLAGQTIGPDDQKQIDAFMDQLTAMVRDAIQWNKLKPQYLDLYAATYDETTIDGMLAFYRTDAGRAMVAKQPELVSKSQAIAQAQLTAVQPKMQAAFEDFAAKMAKSAAAKQK
ncbi:DUF2059 domain-containing protein [Terriglobus sp. TAA 43]|uniref:DUF2059 domain-containing protein n=1 Tax=Terriglobus sp. TAA 43 TaxID=278961 RepID=UPI000645B4C5|nr:DUF2059 domain-containing protein [Terriglobus sp. TAA 43]